MALSRGWGAGAVHGFTLLFRCSATAGHSKVLRKHVLSYGTARMVSLVCRLYTSCNTRAGEDDWGGIGQDSVWDSWMLNRSAAVIYSQGFRAQITAGCSTRVFLVPAFRPNWTREGREKCRLLYCSVCLDNAHTLPYNRGRPRVAFMSAMSTLW